jgi:hypothetical protein
MLKGVKKFQKSFKKVSTNNCAIFSVKYSKRSKKDPKKIQKRSKKVNERRSERSERIKYCIR